MNTAEAGVSRVTDHLFAPTNEHQRLGHWWQRCGTCGLGSAAHVGTGVRLETPGLPYRCPDCVHRGYGRCVHQFMREGER